MKRFDDSTKKLIKNVAALITSALVLVAATVAWFTHNGNASIGSYTGNALTSSCSVTYYALPNQTDTEDSGDVHNVLTSADDSSFVTDEAAEDYGERDSSADLIEAKIGDDRWDETDDWSIASLYPGEFRSFKIDFRTYSAYSPELVFSSLDYDGTNEAVVSDMDDLIFGNVFLRVQVYSVSSGSYSLENEIFGSFSDFLSGSDAVVDLDVSLSPNDSIVILVDIGMPGEGDVTEHGLLQETADAEISFTQVSVVES